MKHLACALALLMSGLAAADDWPVFRGPDRNGISKETDWAPWKGAPRILWKAQVGQGYSSLAVAGGRAFTLGHDGKKEDGQTTIWCLDVKNGRPIWKHTFSSKLNPYAYEGGATSTPTVDGERVYVQGRWGNVFCLDAATGKIVWKKNIRDETGAKTNDWGFTGAPIVHGKLLLLNVGSSGAALDKETGKLAWKSSGGLKAGYSTPLGFTRGSKTLYVFSNEKAYVAADPETGREAWSVRWPTKYGCNIADPIIDGTHLLLATGYRLGSGLYDIGTGSPKEVWINGDALQVHMNQGVLIDGHVYGVSGNSPRGKFQCVELKTGEVKWNRKDVGTGAVSAAQDQLFVLTEDGKIMIGPASPRGFEPVAQAKILDRKCWTAPVLANGVLYCRSGPGQIVALDVRKK